MSNVDLLYTNANVPNITKQNKPLEPIYEWYPWSYFNVIFGCLIMGFIAVFFSFRTTTYKETGNISKARLWSYVTLLWNIVATCTGISLTFYAILKH